MITITDCSNAMVQFVYDHVTLIHTISISDCYPPVVQFVHNHMGNVLFVRPSVIVTSIRNRKT